MCSQSSHDTVCLLFGQQCYVMLIGSTDVLHFSYTLKPYTTVELMWTTIQIFTLLFSADLCFYSIWVHEMIL